MIYIYSECPLEMFPIIKCIEAKSEEAALTILKEKYIDKFEDPSIEDLETIEDLQIYLNSEYTFVISELYDVTNKFRY